VHDAAVHPDVQSALRCPVCGQPLEDAGTAFHCTRGHSFDRARQGYVSLLHGSPASTGDRADMVAARLEWLAGGHYRPLIDALVAEAQAACPESGIVVDAGGGPGFYLAAVIDALPGRLGLSMDVSKYAARRAAKIHPRVDAIVADTMARLPLGDGTVALLLDVFAPRNGSEFRRVLRPDGAAIVVTPGPDHLLELRRALQLLSVDPDKEARVARSLAPSFEQASAHELDFEMEIGQEEARLLVAMGPSAWHRGAEKLLADLAVLPDRMSVRAALRLQVWRPRAARG